MKTAFDGDKKLKTKYVNRVKDHRDADEIVQGIYWENGKGCAVGCTMEHDNTGINIHQRMENKLGIPSIVARLEDRIFEGLSNTEAKEFPLQFLKAINPGADLSLVSAKFFVWLLIDPIADIADIAADIAAASATAHIATWTSVREKHFKKMADKLIEILKDTK